MKKLILIFLLLSLGFGSSNIGVVSSMKGHASLIRGQITSSLKLGQELNKSDKITTESDSKVQLTFKDKTIVTVGKNSEVALNEYNFDGDKSQVDLGFKKGLFKVMTGKIGKLNPQAFSIKTSNATIGIRGTQIVGESSPKLDTIACTSGAITVGDIENKNPVLVNAGQVTFVVPGELPTPPKNFTAKELKKLASTSTKESKASSSKSQTNESTTTEVEESEQETEVAQVDDSLTEQITRETQSGGAVGSIIQTMNGYVTTSTNTNVGDFIINFHEGQSYYEEGSSYTYNNLSGSGSLGTTTISVGDISFAQLYSGYDLTEAGLSEEQIESLSSFYSEAAFNYMYSTLSTTSGETGLLFGSYTDYYAYGEWVTLSGDYGQFVVGELTPSSVISDLISSNAEYTYSTNLGTFIVNFGTGYLNLDAGNYVDGYGTVNNSGFSYSDSSYGLDGNFYGPAAEAVGGVLEDKTNDTTTIMYGDYSSGV